MLTLYDFKTRVAVHNQEKYIDKRQLDMLLEKLKLSIKKNKLLYYIKSIAIQAVPRVAFRTAYAIKIKALTNYDRDDLEYRLNYYNKLDEPIKLSDDTSSLKDVKSMKASSAYIFDTLRYTNFFEQNLKAHFIFGDVIHVSDVPSIQKSRPINENNKNAILLNLDKKRHFLFLNDPVPYQQKISKLIGRGSITQPHRIRFFEQYFNHPKVDIGQINRIGGRHEWIKPKMSIIEHLKYKFILSLEGNDVATNLKWIMSSSSIAVMPIPKYETWFMEGRLIPNYHYILIKDDFSDLENQLDYYLNNEAEAVQIVRNANAYIRQFQDSRKEDLLSLLVLEKYFYKTSQLPSRSI